MEEAKEIAPGIYVQSEEVLTVSAGLCTCSCHCCYGVDCPFCIELTKRFVPENISCGEYEIKANEAEFLEWFEEYKSTFQTMEVDDPRWRSFITEVLSGKVSYNKAEVVRESMHIWPESLEAFLLWIEEREKINVEEANDAEMLDILRARDADKIGVTLEEYKRFLKRLDLIQVEASPQELFLLEMPPVIPDKVIKAHEREKKIGWGKKGYFKFLTSEEQNLSSEEQKEIEENIRSLAEFRDLNGFPFLPTKVFFSVAGYEFATADTNTFPSPKVVNGLDGLEEYRGNCIKSFRARYTPEPHGMWLYFFLDEEGWHMGKRIVSDKKTVKEIEALYNFFCKKGEAET